jgi:hypothetical protein
MKFKYSILSCENHCIGSPSFWKVFEKEYWSDLIEKRNLFDEYTFVQGEGICTPLFGSLDLFEYEKLILLLLVHDQVFTTDNSKPVFTFGYCHPYDLIWLPTDGCEQTNRYPTTHLESWTMIDENLVNL